jgi:hypothetical protein
MGLAEGMGSNFFNLRCSKKDDPTSEGYQICNTISLDPEIKQQLTNIAKKHNFAMKEEKGQVIIYKPKKA